MTSCAASSVAWLGWGPFQGSHWGLPQVLWWFFLSGKDLWMSGGHLSAAEHAAVHSQVRPGRICSCVRPCPTVSLWLLPRPQAARWVWRLLWLSEQSQVAPGPWEKVALGAVSSWCWGFAVCSNTNENSPWGIHTCKPSAWKSACGTRFWWSVAHCKCSFAVKFTEQNCSEITKV